MDRALVDPVLIDALKEGQMHAASLEIFKRIEKESSIETIFGHADKEEAHPGVAATVGQRQITVRELAECCIDRHGPEVLDKIIDHKMLAQALKQRQLAVDPADLDSELARAAVSMGQLKPDGKPDVEGWLKQVTTQARVEVDVYMVDAVWPSVALKKLVGSEIPSPTRISRRVTRRITDPGPICRAIILSNQRKAQEVWEKARDNLTLENFEILARQYSNDSASGSLGGQVPPIQRHGGQPLLEAEAFALKPGELSSVVQVGENFIILFCEGYTKPISVEPGEARRYIEEDLHEKKDPHRHAQGIRSLAGKLHGRQLSGRHDEITPAPEKSKTRRERSLRHRRRAQRQVGQSRGGPPCSTLNPPRVPATNKKRARPDLLARSSFGRAQFAAG